MEIKEGVEDAWKMCRWRREDVMRLERAFGDGCCAAEEEEEDLSLVRMRLCMMSRRRRMEKVWDKSRRTTACPFPPRGTPWYWLGRRAVAMMRWRSWVLPEQGVAPVISMTAGGFLGFAVDGGGRVVSGSSE